MHIELFFKEYFDLELLEKGFKQRLLRLFVTVAFKKKDTWSDKIPAIVDTGSPVSVLPCALWQECNCKIFAKTQIRGMVPDKSAFLNAHYGQIALAFVDHKNVSPEFICKAFLAETNDLPVIIGFSDLLDKVKLVVDYPQKQAFLSI